MNPTQVLILALCLVCVYLGWNLHWLWDCRRDGRRLQHRLRSEHEMLLVLAALVGRRPDVPGPMPHMPDGGNWEGGTTDTLGRRWIHVPNQGWELSKARLVYPPVGTETTTETGMFWQQLRARLARREGRDQ